MLKRHTNATLNSLAEEFTYFWDYGNAFFSSPLGTGADVLIKKWHEQISSYVEECMGPMCFDYGLVHSDGLHQVKVRIWKRQTRLPRIF